MAVPVLVPGTALGSVPMRATLVAVPGVPVGMGVLVVVPATVLD